MSGTIEQDRIEENLRATRSRMDQRLNQLQGKLAPGQVVGDLLDYVRGNGGGEFGRNLLAAVQANPVPAVVAGMGMAWLMVSNRQATAVPTPPRNLGVTDQPYTYIGPDDWRERVAEAESGVSRADNDTDQTFGERMDTARAGAMGLARHGRETASAFSDRVKAAMSGGVDSLTRNSHDLRDKAAGLAGQASAMAGQVAGQAGQMGTQAAGAAGQLSARVAGAASQMGTQVMQGAQMATKTGSDMLGSIGDNPLALGMIGLAAGAVLALLLPSSDQEEQALGGIATQARGAARDAAQAVVDQGSEVAQKVVQSAKDSAAAHGFSGDKSVQDVLGDARSGDLIEQAKQVATDVLSAGSKAAKNDNAD